MARTKKTKKETLERQQEENAFKVDAPVKLRRMDAAVDFKNISTPFALSKDFQKGGFYPSEAQHTQWLEGKEEYYWTPLILSQTVIPPGRPFSIQIQDEIFYSFCKDVVIKKNKGKKNKASIHFVTVAYDSTDEDEILVDQLYSYGTFHDALIMDMDETNYLVKLKALAIAPAQICYPDMSQEGVNYCYARLMNIFEGLSQEEKSLYVSHFEKEGIKYFKKFKSKEEFEKFEKYFATIKELEKRVIFLGSVSLLDDAKLQKLLELQGEDYFLQFLEFFKEDEKLGDVKEKIARTLQKELDKHQKEYYLREQLQIIYRELGDAETVEAERDKYLEQIRDLPIPKENKALLIKEINKLPRYQPGIPEATILRNYLDLVVALPWGKVAKENLNLKVAREALEKNHKHMDRVKERILQYLAVRKMQMEDQNYMNPTILCLVGPPGVGKTTIAKSMAEALGRPYIRMSLGGVRDEAEIRGHRRTYVGAMPGRLISALRQAKFDNPLILLDEIDKLGHDFRGDPSSALLELLDPGQNDSFRDHYLEIPYDFSKVLFVTTANDLSQIPDPLLDRLEILNLEGYTDLDKLSIAKEHLWPKLLQKASFKGKLELTDEAILAIIRSYTRESGVRQLERELSKLIRKIALLKEEKKWKNKKILPEDLPEYLYAPKFSQKMKETSTYPGIVTGLAWTASGGDVLQIEVLSMPGKGKLELTGNLGQVMKESAQVALSFVRSYSETLGIPLDTFEKTDLHIHVPEGAVPKDGPSAGITLTLAIASALKKVTVSSDIAMTGEVSMVGRVLPIGGLKEKLLAAKRFGISKVYIPQANEKDYLDLSEEVKQGLEIVFLNHVKELLTAEIH